MNERNSILQHIKLTGKDSEFAKDVICEGIFEAKQEIHNLVRKWSEGMDLASTHTKKPTKYLRIFELLFEYADDLTYKEIALNVGGANIEKYVYKCNIIAIGKAVKMSKTSQVYKQILVEYYDWLETLLTK